MRLSNKAATWIGVFVIFFIIVGLYAVRNYRMAFEANVQTASAERSGSALKLVINRALSREWDSLEALSKSIDVNDLGRLQSMANTMPRASQGMAWAGFVSPDGTVVAGTGGAEVGWNVANTGWFRTALRGPAMSDPFEAKTGKGLQSVINLAYPVRREDGRTSGVLIYRLSMDWLKNIVVASSRALDMDAFVVDSEGNVVVAANTISGAPPSAASLQAARLSMLRGQLPVDTREVGYVSASIPRLLGNSLRSNDWSLIVRMPNHLDVALGNENWKRVETALILIAGMVALCLIAALRMFLRPIEALSQAFRDLSQGKTTYPPEFRSSREARDLSASLAMLQSQMDLLHAQVNQVSSGHAEGLTRDKKLAEKISRQAAAARLVPRQGGRYRKAG